MALPYQGNKQEIAEDLLLFLRRSFPEKQNFYDLFGGGGNISEVAIKYWKRVVYNELNTSIYLAFKSLIEGDFKKHLPKSEFITGEMFKEIKASEHSARRGLVLCCWSFGNNQMNYLYSKEIEPWKQALHNIVFTDSKEVILESFDIMDQRVFDKPYEYTIQFDKLMADQLLKTPKKDRRFKIRKCVKERMDLQSLERLQSLESLQSLQSLESYNFDYKDVFIKENSLVYCDIPYNSNKTKGSYGLQFDHETFYKWAADQNETVVFSDYLENVPKEFEVIWSKSKVNKLAGGGGKKSTEILAWNKKGNLIQTTLFE